MTTFLVLGVVGLVVLAVSLLVGDVLDGVLDGALDGLGGDWFSTEVLGGFVSALGFGGALAQSLGAPLVVSLPVGLVAGVAFGWLAAWLTRLLRDGSGDDALSSDDAIGVEGTVVSAIPADGFGIVTVRRGEQLLRYNARSELPLEQGTAVHVTQALSPTAVAVAPLWNTLDPS